MTKFLDPLDSAFILLETPGTSMNIGAVVELDPDDVGDPRERFDTIRRNIADRIPFPGRRSSPRTSPRTVRSQRIIDNDRLGPDDE